MIRPNCSNHSPTVVYNLHIQNRAPDGADEQCHPDRRVDGSADTAVVDYGEKFVAKKGGHDPSYSDKGYYYVPESSMVVVNGSQDFDQFPKPIPPE